MIRQQPSHFRNGPHGLHPTNFFPAPCTKQTVPHVIPQSMQEVVLRTRPCLTHAPWPTPQADSSPLASWPVGSLQSAKSTTSATPTRIISRPLRKKRPPASPRAQQGHTPSPPGINVEARPAVTRNGSERFFRRRPRPLRRLANIEVWGRGVHTSSAHVNRGNVFFAGDGSHCWSQGCANWTHGTRTSW